MGLPDGAGDDASSEPAKRKRKPKPKPRPKPPRRGAKALVRNAETQDRLSQLGAIQCDLTEVARDFGAAAAEVETFLSKWGPGRAAYEQSAADARRQLRAAQFKLAEKSPTMAIFLGKQYLGQAAGRESDASARAAEAAVDAEFVRRALASLAADGGAAGDLGSGEGGEPGEPAATAL